MKRIPLKWGRDADGMRAAGRRAADVLARICSIVAPGLTTLDVDRRAAEFIREAGCRSAFLGYRGFPGHICISINDEVVHGIGGARRIQYGDLVKIDCGVILDGWFGDTATTVPVGPVSPDVAPLLEATEGALHAGIAQAREGRRLRDVSAAVEDHVLARGFSVVREFVGHGVGRKLHEEPQIPNYRDPHGERGPRLRAGMTLAIEPMVNRGAAPVKVLADRWTVVTADGSLSAHFEHTVLVTRDEPEILTWRAPLFHCGTRATPAAPETMETAD